MKTSLKPFQQLSLLLPACLLLSFLALMTNARAATTNSPAINVKTNSLASATNSTGSATNLAPAELPVPLAMFDLTAKPTKDPFFPLSLRQPVTTPTNASPAFSASAFNLKGLSGATGRRLALINNRTVAAGEDAEVTTASGKIKIQCVEIKEASVIIRAETQADLLEIFLRKSAQ
jgi:hypothetical protein